MNEEEAKQIRAIQDSLLEASRSYFVEGEGYLEALMCTAQSVVTFLQLLRKTDLAAWDSTQLSDEAYVVFSGIKEFIRLNSGYTTTGEATRSGLDWRRPLSLASLQEQFTSKYEEFLAETDFVRRCRLLLDLFKLQIVFAGFTFEL
jgi:hypothetical protein